VDQYLAAVSPSCRAVLEKLRQTIHSLVPGVQECISYRLPAFRFEGKVIAGFSATAKGCSFYPFSGRTLSTLADEVASYDQTKSALHFSTDRPLPKTLVRKLLKTRLAECGLRPKLNIRPASTPRK